MGTLLESLLELLNFYPCGTSLLWHQVKSIGDFQLQAYHVSVFVYFAYMHEDTLRS